MRRERPTRVLSGERGSEVHELLSLAFAEQNASVASEGKAECTRLFDYGEGFAGGLAVVSGVRVVLQLWVGSGEREDCRGGGGFEYGEHGEFGSAAKSLD